MNNDQSDKIRQIQEHAFKRLAEAGGDIGLPNDSRYLIQTILEAVNVSEPIYDLGEESSGLVTAFVTEPREVFGQSGIAGGVCIKPGNIRLDLGRVIRLVPSSSKAIEDNLIASIALFAVTLWEIASSAKRNLTINQVVVFRAMWELSGGQRGLSENEILNRANADLGAQGASSLSERELVDILEALLDLKCIQVGSLAPRNWTVSEQIEYQYE